MPQLAAELAALGTRVMPASISRWFIRHGYRFKKTLRASEQERSDVRQAREHWRTKRQPRMRQEPHRLIFLDETGTSTKMTRLRGRSPKGQRLYANVRPLADPDLRCRVALLRTDRALGHRRADDPARL